MIFIFSNYMQVQKFKSFMINIEEEILCTLDKNHVIKSWLCHMIDFLKIKCKFPIFSFSFSLDMYLHIKSTSINED